ncbi:hypothetical protein EYZ11_008136 [Aspergillus tanneri]|uniref:Nephrocystin 3-like N-terminal domain-containing protein n=1 Tax=Aspergillus tanneri TaxID=1220188 RepID=A0A4S3JBE5_9EURO|nr:hypothetical protein EYZ11_008136 [Aspergillus tanneri]
MRRIAKKWGEWESEVREKLHRPKPPLATSASNPAIHVAKLEEASIPQDLWQAAYNQLEEEEQAILSKIRVPAPPNGEDEDCSQTKAVIDEVIQITKEQYKDYQQGGLKIRRPTGGDINLRQLSRKIISAAWSFKDAISAVAAFDPTSHAASAWAVVLFGLMMTKNVCDLRDAMFKSSEYLADILARCAYIEINFYHNRTEMGPEMRSTIIRVYKIILRYAAEMFNVQMSSMGRRVLNSVTTITNHPLMSLQSSVKEEEQYLYQFVQLDQHLHRKEEAERLLAQTDRLEESVQDVIQKFNLLNLHIAEGAFYDSYLNQHEDICLPDTRMEIRRQITEWAESSESKCIFWLNGMAGTGKSTIARTVAQSFKEKGQLGATFFFKRGEADRANAKRLISTIAQQLVIKHWQLAPGILKAIELDPNISAKSLREQFDKLILQPLETLNAYSNIPDKQA